MSNCGYAWVGCPLVEFYTTGLNGVTICVHAWEGCTGLILFDAGGLTNVTDCTNAWINTTEWTLGRDFKTYNDLVNKQGWLPGEQDNSSPKTAAPE
jgi:hypothetical protein